LCDAYIVPSVVTCAFELPKTLVSNVKLMTAPNYKTLTVQTLKLN